MAAIWIQQALELEPAQGDSSHHLLNTKLKRTDMPNLSERYVAALAELRQFLCVVGDKSTLTHVLTGVRVAPETMDEDAQDASLLSLTYATGHTVHVVASLYFELQLAEDAAHKLHAVGEGSGEIHQRASQLWEHLTRKHNLVI